MNKTKTIYKNGAYSKIILYHKRRKGLHNSDRIRLIIKAEKGEPFEVYMHALEAIDIINGLSRAVGDAMADELPLLSKD